MCLAQRRPITAFRDGSTGGGEAPGASVDPPGAACDRGQPSGGGWNEAAGCASGSQASVDSPLVHRFVSGTGNVASPTWTMPVPQCSKAFRAMVTTASPSNTEPGESADDARMDMPSCAVLTANPSPRGLRPTSGAAWTRSRAPPT